LIELASGTFGMGEEREEARTADPHRGFALARMKPDHESKELSRADPYSMPNW
jgi:hypothetical protein